MSALRSGALVRSETSHDLSIRKTESLAVVYGDVESFLRYSGTLVALLTFRSGNGRPFRVLTVGGRSGRAVTRFWRHSEIVFEDASGRRISRRAGSSDSTGRLRRLCGQQESRRRSRSRVRVVYGLLRVSCTCGSALGASQSGWVVDASKRSRRTRSATAPYRRRTSGMLTMSAVHRGTLVTFTDGMSPMLSPSLLRSV